MAEEPSDGQVLGDTDAAFKVDSIDEYRDACLSMAEQTGLSLDIFSQDLEAEIYDNRAFEQAVFKLAKKHPNTRIRILVQDSRPAVQDGHSLIRLAQSLTSSVFIHNPSREFQTEQSAFLLADKVGFIYRADASDRNYSATVNFRSLQRASKLTEFFTEIWEHSTPDPQARRIYM